ncbi:hypothetical protein GCM10009845_09890 [Pedococcus bigeumensis]
MGEVQGMNEHESRGQRDASGDTLDREDADLDLPDTQAEEAASREAAHEDRHAVDGRLIARLRAEGLWHEEHAAHLGQALRSSRKIGAAIGIVMADLKVGEVAAFEILSRVSQHTNRKLNDVAHEVVDAGSAASLPLP